MGLKSYLKGLLTLLVLVVVGLPALIVLGILIFSIYVFVAIVFLVIAIVALALLPSYIGKKEKIKSTKFKLKKVKKG